jgi:hypothetical protein
MMIGMGVVMVGVCREGGGVVCGGNHNGNSVHVVAVVVLFQWGGWVG